MFQRVYGQHRLDLYSFFFLSSYFFSFYFLSGGGSQGWRMDHECLGNQHDKGTRYEIPK